MKPYSKYKQTGITWIGEIPQDWYLSKLKWLITSNDGGVWGNDPMENGTRVLRSTEISVDGKWNNLKDSAYRDLSDAEIRKSKVEIGDLIITKSSGSELHIGKTAVVDKRITSEITCYSNFMQRIRPNTKMNSQFGYWYLNSQISRVQYQIFSNTTTGLANLNSDTISNLYIPISVDTSMQKKIASYLNYKIFLIDNLISKNKQLIQLLEEKKQATINQVVTKGLDPTVKMKDSGIEWIGKVPEHWEIKPLFAIFSNNKTKNINQNEKNVLSLSYGRIIKRNVENSFGLLPSSFQGYQVVASGYIILRLTDLQNDKKSLRVGLSKEHGIITSAYIGLVPKNKLSNSQYYYYLLHSYDIGKVLYGLGNGVRQTLNFSELKWLPLLSPSEEELVKIAQYLDGYVEKIENKKNTLISQNLLLREYRQTLISSAVTGKIDVRDEPIPEEFIKDQIL